VVYAILVAVSYLQILRNPQFLSDDFTLLAQIRKGVDVWNHGGEGFYRPVVGKSLAMLWRVFGAHALPYHVANLALLVVSALLVRAIFIELSRDVLEERVFAPASFFAGALFAVWPAHAEPVSWIAGMTDTLSVPFALGSTLLFARYRRSNDPKLFVASLAALWVGLCAKESLITWPLIVVLGPTIVLYRRGDPKPWARWAGELAIFLLVGAIYVLWRSHVIGTLVGGYGAKTHLNFNYWEMLEHFGAQMADAFLPGNKLFAGPLGDDATRKVITFLVGFLVLCFLRKAPRPDRFSSRAVLVSEVLFLALALQRINLLTNENNLDYYAPRIYAVEALGLAIFAFFRYKYAAEPDEKTLARTRAAFYVAVLIALDIYRVEYLVLRDFAALLALFALAYASRPRSFENDRDERIVRLGLVSVLAAPIAALPAINLTISLNGESSRFVYGASAFGCIALTCCALLFVDVFNYRRAIAAALIAVAALAMYLSNEPWARASEISRQTVAAIKSLGPTRRLYVLVAPDTIDGAFVFRDGLKRLPEIEGSLGNVQVIVGSLIRNGGFGDTVRWERHRRIYFPILQARRAGRRLYRPTLMSAEDLDAGTYIEEIEGGELLKGFDPAQDHVLTIDTTSAVVLR
jgi:hypothetical protein